MGCSCSDWLEDFVEHTAASKFSEKVRYWVGVSVVAGALRRKVWIDQYAFQWTPNFFILLVGPPGSGKSTAMGLGYRILRRVEGINFGPNEQTIQDLVKKLSEVREEWTISSGNFEMSCMSYEISEFGTFFDPTNRQQVDTLTDLWDAKLGNYIKSTKTNGEDEIVNPWLNLIAGCTQGWVDDNITEKFVKSGFASRLVYVPFEETKRIPYITREPKIKDAVKRENELYLRLDQIAQLGGEMRLTDEAYEWGERWYNQYRDVADKLQEKEQGLYARSQTHLHKLAMVVSAARGKFPIIDAAELQEADRRLSLLTGNINAVFGRMGQSPQSKLAQDVLEVLVKHGSMTKRELFAKYFFRTVSSVMFEEAVKSIKAGGLVKETGDMSNPMMEVV